MTERTCGTCNLCCKVMAIDELQKPRNHWCQHARNPGGGCSIYADRPNECQTFTCLWLHNAYNAFPDDCRPDLIKGFFTADEDCLTLHEDPGYPGRASHTLRDSIHQMRQAGATILVCCGSKNTIMPPIKQ